MKNWLLLMYIRLLTFFDTVGVTPKGLKIFAFALIIGIVMGIML